MFSPEQMVQAKRRATDFSCAEAAGGSIELHNGALPDPVDDRAGRAAQVERPDGVVDPDSVAKSDPGGGPVGLDAHELLMAVSDRYRDSSEVLIKDAGDDGAEEIADLGRVQGRRCTLWLLQGSRGFLGYGSGC